MQGMRALPAGWWVDANGVARRPGEQPPATVDSKPGQAARSIGRAVRLPNKTEARLLLILKARYPGSVVQYEPLTLLCGSCRYTPDFVVSPGPGQTPFVLLMFECKGPFKREKDLLRLKAAAVEHPYIFTLCEESRDRAWTYTAVQGAGRG